MTVKHRHTSWLSNTDTAHDCQPQTHLMTVHHRHTSWLSNTDTPHDCQTQTQLMTVNHRHTSWLSTTDTPHDCPPQTLLMTVNYRHTSRLSTTDTPHDCQPQAPWLSTTWLSTTERPHDYPPQRGLFLICPPDRPYDHRQASWLSITGLLYCPPQTGLMTVNHMTGHHRQALWLSASWRSTTDRHYDCRPHDCVSTTDRPYDCPPQGFLLSPTVVLKDSWSLSMLTCWIVLPIHLLEWYCPGLLWQQNLYAWFLWQTHTLKLYLYSDSYGVHTLS